MKTLYYFKDNRLLVAGAILVSWVSVGIVISKLLSLHIY